MFFKREVMFFELPGAGGNDIFWAPRTVYFNLYAFCGASDINNFWQCLDILYECVFDSFTGTDLALTPTSVLTLYFSFSLFLSLFLTLSFSLFLQLFFFSLYFSYHQRFFRVLHFAFSLLCRPSLFGIFLPDDTILLRWLLHFYVYLPAFLVLSTIVLYVPSFLTHFTCIYFRFPTSLMVNLSLFSFSLTFPDFHPALPV